jgi:hypothetical protein
MFLIKFNSMKQHEHIVHIKYVRDIDFTVLEVH